MYIEKTAEITIDLDKLQRNGNELGQLIQKNSQELEEIAVADILDFVAQDAANQDLHTEVYTVSLSNETALDDFGAEFFSSAAVSIEGALEYGAGKIAFTESFETAKITFSTEKAALTLTLTNYVKPEKPIVPETEDGFVYRFFTESATVADILTANEIVSSYYNIVSLSDENLVTVEGDALTVNNYFGEVVLTVALSDGTEVEIKLQNPAPIEAGQTVTGDDGSFTADAAVPAGTMLSVEAAQPTEDEKTAVKTKAQEVLGEAASDVAYYDISLVGPDGSEIETGAAVTVKVDLPLPKAPEGKLTKVTSVKVFHVTDGGVDVLDADWTLGENGITSVSFATDGFSLFGIVYTVDFVANGYTFSYPGKIEFNLSEMLTALHAEFTAADVVNIEFSNNRLFRIEKTENDWIIEGIQSFETVETMTLTLLDGTKREIRVTDPVTNATVDLNELDDSNPPKSKDAAVFTVDASNAVKQNDQNRDASITLNMHVELTEEAFGKLRSASGFPTIVYDFTEYLDNPDVPIAEIPAKTQPLYDGARKIGQVRFENNTMVMTITDLDWLEGQTRYEADFNPTIKIDENKLGTRDEYDFQFPGTTTTLPIHFKEITFNSQKTVNYEGRNENGKPVITKGDDGKYRLTYTVTLNNPTELDTLTFSDTMTGTQTLDGPITVTGAGKTATITGRTGQTFNIDVKQELGLDKAPKGEYKVTYTTVISESDLLTIGEDGTPTTQKNAANWKVTGDKDVTPDPVEITPYKDRPPMTVEKKVNGQTGRDQTGWNYGTELNYSISFGSEDKPMAGITIWDTMTDNQKLSGNITVAYKDKNGTNQTITLTQDQIGDQAKDTSYSANQVNLFRFNLPDDAGNGPVTVTYKTNIISKQEAIDNKVYSTQSVFNQAGAENVSSETEGKVTFPDKPEQKKEVSASQGAVNGSWQLGDTLTYTVTYGSKDIPLAGTTISDSMTKLQNLTGNITVTYSDNSTGTITSTWQTVSGQNFSTEMGEVFNYTFPDSETHNGPVTITYQTTLISEDQVRALNISGNQNVVNTFTVDNNPTSTTGRIPTNEPNTVQKSVVNKTTSGNTWQPGDELEYTIVFAGDRLAGSTITDNATDIQELTTDITLKDSSNPANTITISKDGDAIGADFKDQNYSTDSKKLFEYTIPSDWVGPVTATYTMQIIDKTTAEELRLYGLQGTNNTATTDRGGSGSTGKNTDFGEKPKIPQTKTVSPVDDDTNGENTGAWQPGEVLHYTLTFGDEKTKMAGYVLTDSMTNLQHLITPQTENGTSSTGISVTYYLANRTTKTIEMPAASISAATGENDYDTGLRQLFNYTLPDDADKGVVTITYSTQVVSLAKATELRIFDVQNVENRFTADGETVTTIGDVPFKDDPKPTKRVEPADSDTYISGNAEGTTGWQPGQELTYTLKFGDEALVMNNRNIWDGMTNTQTLDGNVTISWGTGADAKSFVMPTATGEYNGDGVCWSYTHTENVYSNEQKTLFNYTLPAADAQLPGAEEGVTVGEIRGPVTVTYQTRVMTQEEADANHLYGTQPVNNTYTFNGQTATTTGDVPFVDQQTHFPAIRKTGFIGSDGRPVFPTYNTPGLYQDGQETLNNGAVIYNPPEGASTNIDLATGRVTWIMEVSAKQGSAYPLTDVTVNDKLYRGQANIGSSYKSLQELYNAGLVKAVQARVTTLSGEVLTPGADYSIEINGSNINYKFDQIDEPTYIALDIYFHEDIVGWYRMSNLACVNSDESTGNIAYIGGYNSKITVTKQGSVVDGTDGRLVKWTVELNPTCEELIPDVDEVNFSDILPDGMVLVNYAQASNGTIDTEHPSIFRNGGGAWNEWNKHPSTGDADTSEIPVTVVGNEIQRVDVRGWKWDYTKYSRLSGTRYHIEYYTWITDEEWQNVTNSESGTKEYENTALFTTDKDTQYSQTTTVEVKEEEFINKEDVSQEQLDSTDNRVKLVGEDLEYFIDVNPHGYTMNEGNPLTLSDRIDTSMNLRVGSIKVFKAPENGVEVTKENIHVENAGVVDYNYAILGEDVTNSIDISYNDDTRMLTFMGIPDGQRYYVVYTAGVRSVGGSEEQTFTNTATLFGKGSYTKTITTTHVTTDFNASARGGMAMMKIDENNVKKGLEGAVFELYRVVTTETTLTKNADGTYTATTADGAEKTYSAVQITVGADENGQYTSDKKGQIKFGSFEFDPNTLYYWVERQAPEGYNADLDVPHHFVLYNTVRDEPDTTQDNMMKAWALDKYWEDEYGIIVASYAMNATWYATNSRYRSITGTKKWEGDSNNLYQLRPTDGVKLTLIRIEEDGTRTPLETVTVRGGNETYWPSYTWNKLPVENENGYEYLYTVEEEPVTDYYAEYSDEGQGIKTGTVTIVNRPTPGKTTVEVEKVWKTGGTVPDSITVRLVQINTDAEGNKYTIPEGQEEKLPTGMSTTAVLRPDADGKWYYKWDNLPTRDGHGGTYSYTVVETSNLADSYTVEYSDGGNGIVKGKITITNILPGSLQITKKVTVNGQPTTGTEADGVYTFNIIDSTGRTIKTVSITITNGVAGELKVDGLAEGMYTIREVMPSNGTAILAGTPKEYTLEVKAGKTAAGEIPVAEFTNNKNTTRLTVKKDWFTNSTEWPRNMEITVRLVEVDENGTTTEVTGREDAAVTLNEEQQTYTWRELDPDKKYTVTEDYLPGFITEIGEVNNKQTVTITNKEATQISFQKVWQGTPPESFMAEVKLMQRERQIVEYGETLRPAPAFEGEYTYAGQTQFVTDTAAHSFENLPKYRHDGTNIYEIEYTIEEGEIIVNGVVVTDQYAGVVTGSMADGYTMTNIPVVDIPVEKIWDGGKPEDVASVEFTLKNGSSAAAHADGTPVAPITLPITDGEGHEVWTAVFEDLPSDGTYTLQETKVTFTDGTEITDPAVIATVFGAEAGDKTFDGVQGKTITNKRVTVDLPVTKAWSDAGTAMAWPDDVASITLQLTAGDPAEDVEGKTLTLTAADAVAGENTYQTQFTGLPKYDRQGQLIVYGLKEVEVTSTNGSVYVSTITVNKESGAVVSFSVANDKVEETQISVTKEWYGSDGTPKANAEGYTISFKVKRVVDGVAEDYTAITAENLTVTPAGAAVTVGNDGIVTMTYNNGWPTVTLNRLLKKVDGKDATYFVEETAYSPNEPEVDTTYKKGSGAASANAQDAACVEDTITIINTDQPEGLKVTKKWVDGFGDPSTNPPVKTVYFKVLYDIQHQHYTENNKQYTDPSNAGWDSGKGAFKIEFNEGEWSSVLFTDLPKVEGGDPIVTYKVVELDAYGNPASSGNVTISSGTQCSVSIDFNGTTGNSFAPDAKGLLTITNAETSQNPKLRVEKVWKDSHDNVIENVTGKTATIEVRKNESAYTIKCFSHGNPKPDLGTAREGDTVTVTFNIDTHGKISITDSADKLIKDINGSDCIENETWNGGSKAGSFTFVMPKGDVKVNVAGNVGTDNLFASIVPRQDSSGEQIYETYATITLPDNGNWYKTIDVAAGGEYWLVETSPASGYEISYTYTPASGTETTEQDTMTGKVSTGRVTVTNKEKAGSLALQKIVNADTGLTVPDGTYTFTVQKVDESGNPDLTSGEKTVVITFQGNTAQSATGGTLDTATGVVTVENLEPGWYKISETAPTNGTVLTGITVTNTGATYTDTEVVNGVHSEEGKPQYAMVYVEAGNDAAADAKAAFTNTLASVDIEVNKAWAPENTWPSNVQSVTVKLQQSVNGGGPTDVPGKTLTITAANSAVTQASIDTMEEGSAKNAAQALLEQRFFRNLPKYDGDGNLITYSVVETAVKPATGATVSLSDFNVTYNLENGTSTGEKITVTNTQKPGDLELTKKVAGNPPAADADKQFKFTITLTAPEGGTLANSYSVVKTSATGNGTTETKNLTWAVEGETTLANQKGSFTVTLAKNEKITIKDLPAGTGYTITEADYSADGYSPSVNTEKAPMTGTITGGTKAKEEVEVTNTYEPGKLVIEKVVVGNATEADKSFQFKICIVPENNNNGNGNAGSYTINGGTPTEIRYNTETTFSLKGGEKAEFTIHKTGAAFTVEEVSADQDGYETTAKLDGTVSANKTVTGTISKTAAITVEYTNTRNATSVEATKAWSDGTQSVAWPDDVQSVEFTLYKTVNGKKSAVTNTDLTDNGFDATGFSNPATIESTTPNPKASWLTLPTRMKVTVAADPENGIEAVPAHEEWMDITYTVEETKVTYTNGTTVEGENIATTFGAVNENGVITNKVPGSVQVTKTFSGIGEALIPSGFQIVASWSTDGGTTTNTRTLTIGGTITDSDVTRSGSGLSYTWTISGLPIGTEVTFTESGYGIAGYNVTSTVAINNAEAGTGTSGSATAAAPAGTVAFVNTYVAGVELPSTGGPGTILYTTAGLGLMALAILALLLKRRKEQMN